MDTRPSGASVVGDGARILDHSQRIAGGLWESARGEMKVGEAGRWFDATNAGVAMFKRILVSVDGSGHANRAIDVAADLAGRYDAHLTVLHVREELGSNRVPPEYEHLARIEHIRLSESEVLQGVAHEIVSKAVTRAVQYGAKNVQERGEVGSPSHKIVETANADDADLIVLGRRDLGGISGLLMGSVSLRVGQLTERPA
ncbi:MAG: nucleotide-binding universal stress UspA family protein [Gammaproteobacteria bacterium]|jgi:nucleotide-binding universal stress UspA family protein